MKHLARSTLIIAVFFGLEKVLGFVRQVLISNTFGRSAALDAFNAANNIPDMLFALISGGALAMALIPVLSEYLETQGRQQAWDLFSRIANLVFLVATGLSILIAIFAKQLVHWNIGIAPGFGPEQQILVANLMRLNLVATIIFAPVFGVVLSIIFLDETITLWFVIGTAIFVPEQGFSLGPITLPALGMGIYGLPGPGLWTGCPGPGF